MRRPAPALLSFIEAELARPVSPRAAAFAAHLAERPGVVAVLFYGSCLQRGTEEGMLDFYALTEGEGAWGEGRRLAAAGRALPPNVYPMDFEGMRAKVAVVPLDVFRARMDPDGLDTTFWARFCQRAALVWSRDNAAAEAASEAVASAVEAGALWAARLAPGVEGADAWRRLFAETYRVEFRVEGPGRAGEIVTKDEPRFAALWPLTAPARTSRRASGSWMARRIAGKALHIARLTKAAFTFEGGPRYLLWKIRRHRRRR